MNNRDHLIDEGWRLYNAAMEACEEVASFLHTHSGEIDCDVDRAIDAAGYALAALDKPYSTGKPILPGG